MPELRFVLKWPDGSSDTAYSPSTIIRDHFVANTSYPMPEFLARSRAALNAASNRVRALYGAPCSLALAQLARIEATAGRFPPNSSVHFVCFKE